jgi:hypothetical protein
MGGREGDSQASDVLDEMKSKKPVQTFYIMGVPYAWVYETDNIGNYPKQVGEIFGSKTVEAIVKPSEDNWHKIKIGFATYNRRNTGELVVHIKDSSNSLKDLATVKIDESLVSNSKWYMAEFPSIAGSKNKSFYVSVNSPNSSSGNAVTVRSSDTGVLAITTE